MDNFEAQLAAVEAANSEPVAKPDNKAVAAVINDASLGAEPAAEPLGLTDGDEAVDVPDGEEGGEEHEADDGKRRRSRS